MSVKYNCVTGWNRGGTSAMMSAIKQAGIPVIGFKYPFQFDIDVFNVKDGKIEKEMRKQDGGILNPSEKIKKLNPTGFWEVSSICLQRGLQNEHKDIGMNGEMVKINFSTLPMSDPGLIDKVVIILRDPRRVLANLYGINKARIKASKQEWVRAVSLGLLYNAVFSLKWLKKNKKEYHIVRYDDLLKRPEDEMLLICNFLGRGDHYWGAKVIDKRLNLPAPITQKCKELTELLGFYRNPTTKYDVKRIMREMKKLNKGKNIIDICKE